MAEKLKRKAVDWWFVALVAAEVGVAFGLAALVVLLSGR